MMFFQTYKHVKNANNALLIYLVRLKDRKEEKQLQIRLHYAAGLDHQMYHISDIFNLLLTQILMNNQSELN